MASLNGLHIKRVQRTVIADVHRSDRTIAAVPLLTSLERAPAHMECLLLMLSDSQQEGPSHLPFSNCHVFVFIPATKHGILNHLPWGQSSCIQTTLASVPA